MSGIAGVVYPDAFQVNHLISKMLDTLSFRGPGKREELTFREIEVGVCGEGFVEHHTKTVIGLDGTVFNRVELRKLLHAAGHPTKSDHSAELILAAYELWDTAFLEHIDGDFALFILDHHAKRLILARDRIGKKPLYWYHDNKHFIFASELKAIIASGAVSQTPALDACAAYLYLGYIPQDISPIQGINKLLPGHYLHFNADHSKVILPYWSYSAQFQHKRIRTQESVSTHLDSLLKQSVAERMPEQKPVGCFISGGLGSASVAYYVKEQSSSDQVRAFTVGFHGENDADIEMAKNVANELHISQQIDLITPQHFLDDYAKIVWFLDEPLADPNVIATWRLSRLAKQCETVFSGMGSDEFLAGHERYTSEQKTNYRSRIIQTALLLIKPVLLPLLNMFYKPGAYALLQQARTNQWQLDYLNQNAVFRDDVLAEASPTVASLFNPVLFLHKFHNLSRIPSNLASFLYFDVKTRLPDCYMLQYDRLTAANGLVWQAPFLAQDIVEFLAEVLTAFEEISASDSSYFLKEIVRHVFQGPVVSRPKKTRNNFLKAWEEDSELHTILSSLPNGVLVDAGIISKKWLQKRVSSPKLRVESFRYLWSILALEIWFRLFINHPISTQPPNMSVKDLLLET